MARVLSLRLAQTLARGVGALRVHRVPQPHLEYRLSGFHWRRRWPQRVLAFRDPPKKMSLLFSLRSHVLPDAKALAWKLTLLSDIVFAGATERTMAIAPDIMERLLVELCRFLIEVADLAREGAPMRTPEIAAHEADCAAAAMDTIRQAIFLRDREIARNPLRQVAARLGLELEEEDSDWQRLAFRALRVMLDVEEENARRDQGVFDRPSAAFRSVQDADRVSAPVRPRTVVTAPPSLSVTTGCAAPRGTLSWNFRVLPILARRNTRSRTVPKIRMVVPGRPSRQR